MNKVTTAYIAGLLDGEGCFRIDRFKSKASPIGFQYRSIVEITMCDKEPIEFLAEVTGKNIYRWTIPSGRIANKIVWRNGPAAELIRAILPYLKGKRREAELCLHFEDNITPGRGRSYRQEDKARCEEVRNQVADLKKPEALRC